MSLILAMFLAIAPVPSGSLQNGVDLYHAGRFVEAAQSFEHAVAADSSDVNAWLNLGNAYFRKGDHGHAVWAWSRAGRLAPRDPAISQNLQAAGAVEVLRTRPPLSVTPAEWYLLAAIAWWIAAAFAVFSIRRKRQDLLYWAGGFIALALFLAFTGVTAAKKRYAVATDNDTVMYGDPTIHSPVVRHVQGGTGLDVLEDRGDWLRVRTLTQSEGWVEADAIGRL